MDVNVNGCPAPLGGMDPWALASYAGAALVVWAYWANAAGKAPSGSWGYRLANLAGALLVLPATLVNHVWASSLLQVVWAAVALWSMGRSLLARGEREASGEDARADGGA